MKKAIVTISREYGSGGHEIGEKLAKELDIPFYDNELISIVAQKSGFSKEVIESAENIPSNNILYSLSKLGPSTEIYGMPLSEKIFLAQSNAIRDLAQESSCVIVGRCADYILRDLDECIRIFVTAPLASRVRRAIAQYRLPRESAQKSIMKTDKSRELYYNYHTGLTWGEPYNYDIIINTDLTGIDNAVNLIKSYILLRKEESPSKPFHNL